jgi:hypothetical protein
MAFLVFDAAMEKAKLAKLDDDERKLFAESLSRVIAKHDLLSGPYKEEWALLFVAGGIVLRRAASKLIGDGTETDALDGDTRQEGHGEVESSQASDSRRPTAVAS